MLQSGALFRIRPARKTLWALVALIASASLLVAVSNAGTALVVIRPIDAPEVIVSLASHEWERLPEVARLAINHPDAIVVLTLPQPATESNCHDCRRRLDRLRHYGVTPDRVHVIPIWLSRGTHAEALAVASYARTSGARRVLVVTSPYHTRRARATFEWVFRGSGVRIGFQPALDTSPARPERWWLAGYDRAYVLYEWSAAIYYAVKHRVPISPD